MLFILVILAVLIQIFMLFFSFIFVDVVAGGSKN